MSTRETSLFYELAAALGECLASSRVPTGPSLMVADLQQDNIAEMHSPSELVPRLRRV